MYKTLSEYIAALERAGELVRVNVPVDPVLEIAELTDREAVSYTHLDVYKRQSGLLVEKSFIVLNVK